MAAAWSEDQSWDLNLTHTGSATVKAAAVVFAQCGLKWCSCTYSSTGQLQTQAQSCRLP